MMIWESVGPTRKRVTSFMLALLGLLAAVVLGVGIVLAPEVALALAALVFVIPLAESSLARMAFVVFGGMVVLGVSDTLSVGKLVYFLGCGLVIGIELLHLPGLRETRAYADVRTVLHVSFVFAVYMVIETALAVFTGAAPTDAVRESAPYLLFACIPLLALDASTSRRDLNGAIFVIASLLGTVSYVVEWLSIRGLGTPTVSKITLAGALPAALLCYLSAGFLLGRRRLPWAAAAGGVLALILLGGNRSSIMFLVGPLAIALVGRAGRWHRILRLAVIGSLVALFAVVTFGYAARLWGVDTSFISTRYESLLHPSELSSDQSLEIRLTQSRVGWSVFRSHPLLGAGPGYIFVWTDPFTGLQSDYPYIDSPLQFPAKFGVLGMVLWFVLVLAYGFLLVRLNRSPSVYSAAALGFGTILAAWTFVGSPMSDKGGLLGFMLLMVLSLPEGRAGMDQSLTHA